MFESSIDSRVKKLKEELSGEDLIIVVFMQTNPESRPPISQVVQAIFECAQV